MKAFKKRATEGSASDTGSGYTAASRATQYGADVDQQGLCSWQGVAHAAKGSLLRRRFGHSHLGPVECKSHSRHCQPLQGRLIGAGRKGGQRSGCGCCICHHHLQSQISAVARGRLGSKLSVNQECFSAKHQLLHLTAVAASALLEVEQEYGPVKGCSKPLSRWTWILIRHGHALKDHHQQDHHHQMQGLLTLTRRPTAGASGNLRTSRSDRAPASRSTQTLCVFKLKIGSRYCEGTTSRADRAPACREHTDIAAAALEAPIQEDLRHSYRRHSQW